jgi:hypothetical protein
MGGAIGDGTLSETEDAQTLGGIAAELGKLITLSTHT